VRAAWPGFNPAVTMAMEHARETLAVGTGPVPNGTATFR
jgi:hypothetical protein